MIRSDETVIASTRYVKYVVKNQRNVLIIRNKEFKKKSSDDFDTFDCAKSASVRSDPRKKEGRKVGTSDLERPLPLLLLRGSRRYTYVRTRATMIPGAKVLNGGFMVALYYAHLGSIPLLLCPIAQCNSFLLSFFQPEVPPPRSLCNCGLPPAGLRRRPFFREDFEKILWL